MIIKLEIDTTDQDSVLDAHGITTVLSAKFRVDSREDRDLPKEVKDFSGTSPGCGGVDCLVCGI